MLVAFLLGLLKYNRLWGQDPAARQPAPPDEALEIPTGAQIPYSHQPMASHRLSNVWDATPSLEGALPLFAGA